MSASAPAGADTYLFIGDSFIFGQGLSDDQHLAAQFAKVNDLKVRAVNLGVPGNVDTTLGTMDAAEGLPVHLTHIQFHSYGTEGERKFSSAAARIAEAINQKKNVSADVGQILFGQTVTASGDNMVQYRNAGHGSPKKSVIMDIECDAGCGVVPFRYKDQNFVNALLRLSRSTNAVAYWLDGQYGLQGVWMAFPIAYVAMLLMQSAYYHFVWRHRKIERLV